MKKIMMMFLVLVFLLSTKSVFAQDQYHLTLEEQSGIYMSRRGVSYGYDSYPFYIYKMDGMFAYCIEPGKHITTYTYTGVEDYVDLGFSEELKEKLELIGYYGRDYPGHNNVRYSMAAQALIWELTGVDKVTFWTKQNEQGSEIDITNERNEIMSLVNNHKTLPNFKTSYTGHLKKEFTINDTNNVLDNFSVTSNGGHDVYIENNTIHITPKKYGKSTISLKRKSYDEYNTIIFVGKGDNSSQKLGRLHFNKEIKTDINLVISGISIIGHKVDENNNPIKKSGIKFKMKNVATGEYVCPGSICTFKTDVNGIFKILSLDYGEYEIEELENQFIPGYYWNSEKLHISLNENTTINWDDINFNHINVNFKNNSVKTVFELYKTGEEPIYNDNGISYKEINLGNITFDLYKENGEYIKTFTVNNNGYAKINDLKVGSYYLIEKTKLNNYIDKDKIPFTIKQNNQYEQNITLVYHLQNILKKGYLEFSKVDSITNKGIPNTIIEIYDSNNKLLYTKTTDNNGKVFIDKLPYGKYYIKEKEANYYYEKTNEIINFEIKNNNETVKSVMKNNKIKGKLEITKLGEALDPKNNSINYQDIPLSNIEFYLYNEKDELITTLKTNSNGYVSYDLPLGKYYLIEKTKLTNYQDNTNKYSFEIKKNGNTGVGVKLTVNNYLKKGNLEFYKEDDKTCIGIPNTIIEIYDVNNNLLFTKTTDNEGKVIINNLSVGKYYVKEKEANYYYKKTDEVVNFEIKNNGETIKSKMMNTKIIGKIEINKQGEELNIKNNNINYQNISLSNIEFYLYNEKDELITTLKTNSNGYVSYELPLGKYYLIEKTKLTNYQDNTNKYDFEIKKNGNKAINVKLTINNYLKKSTLELDKIDSISYSGIPNTIVEIYNDLDELLLTKETNENGKIIINDLPYGKYYIKEKEANYYYKPTDEIINFEVKKHGEIIKKTLINEKIVGNVEINKKGENYHFINNDIYYEKVNLHAIEFDLYDDNDNLIGHIMTDNNGYAKYSNLPIGEYYLIERTGLERFNNNGEKYYFEIKKKDLYTAFDVNLEIVNYLKKGNLEFSKTDYVTSVGIPDTVIEIYNENNILLFTKETDKDGKVIIPNLPFGKYYILEKEANYYYEKTNEKVMFEVKENGEIIKAKMDNKKIVGNLEIKKIGEEYHIVNNNIVYDKETIHSIEFDIFDENDHLVGNMITDNNGYSKYTNLPLGKYYLIEKTKLDNYITNVEKIPFEIKKDSNNKAINVMKEIDNYLKKGTLEFTKIDFVTSVGIPDTVIEIYNENDVLLFTKTTDKNGKVIINNLPYGKYYIVEKTPNYYYEKNDEKVMFEIKENGDIVKAVMTNKKILGNLEIEKIGEEYRLVDGNIVYEKNKLSNIEFDLFDNNDNLISTIKTDSNGLGKYEGLPLGKYYLIEKTKLDNYISNDEKIYFEIKKNGNKTSPVQLKIENTLKKGSLLFSKTDLVTSEGIPNTIIEIYDENNNLWFTKETDEEGRVIINDLPVGKYYIVEKEANTLYMLTNEKVMFEIKENGEIIRAFMTNEKIEIPVPKTSTKESVIVNLFLGISSILGIGGIYYERKKAY